MNHKLSLFLILTNILALGLLIGSLVVEDVFVKKVLVLTALAVMIAQKIFDLRVQTEKSKKIFSAIILAFLIGAFGFFLMV